MAESIVGGLFGINPAMYQQQQQQQVLNNAIAMQKLSPFEQAGVGLQQAGYNFAGALGGAMGGVDPQLQRISALNAISKQINQSNPESMMQGAKMLADAGFQQEAFGLAEYARKAASELALAKQRGKEGQAAGVNKDIQLAEYTATIRNAIKKLQAGPPSPETDNQIAELQGRLDALPQPKDSPLNAKITEAQRAGQITSQLSVLKGLPLAQQSPEAIQALETELAVLMPSKADAQNSQIAQGLRVGELTGQIGVLEELPEAQQNKPLIRKLKAELSFLTKGDKAETQTSEVKNATAYANSLGFESGSKEWQKSYAEKFAELIAVKGTEATKANIKDIGKSSTGNAVYLDVNNDEQFIYKIVDGKTVRQPYAGTVDRTTSKVSASATSTGGKQDAAFETGLGKGQADRLLASQEKAQSAADILATNEVGRSLLNSGAITGAGADFFVGLNKALKQANIDFGYADAASNSQAYAAAMAANAGLLIKQFGAGTGLSDADREYATKAAAGQISMDETAIRKVLDINDRAARNVIERHNKSVKGIKTNIPLEVEIPIFTQPSSGAALIPTKKPVATAIPQSAIDALKAGKGTDAQFDEIFGAGAAKRARGIK